MSTNANSDTSCLSIVTNDSVCGLSGICNLPFLFFPVGITFLFQKVGLSPNTYGKQSTCLHSFNFILIEDLLLLSAVAIAAAYVLQLP